MVKLWILFTIVNYDQDLYMKNVWHSQDKTKTILFATLSNTHTNTRTTLTLFVKQFLFVH